VGRQPKTLGVGRILRGAAAKGRLLAALLAYPDVKTDWKTPKALSALPVIPLSLVKDDKTLNYFSMVTTVGTPQAIAAQELRIECMFPADEATESHHIAMIGDVEARP